MLFVFFAQSQRFFMREKTIVFALNYRFVERLPKTKPRLPLGAASRPVIGAAQLGSLVSSVSVGDNS